MTDRVLKIAEGFWNVRGSFKVAGLLDLGTQASLVRLRSGDLVLLDAYALKGDAAREIMALTDQGRALRAILCLHPFHTLHVRATALQFPGARLYGTARHVQRAPELPWEPLHAELADDFSFSVPRGVDFIPQNEQLHFASVLALHRPSGTLHVDDTLSYLRLPWIGGLQFHPSLRAVLQKRPGAAGEFRAWAHELVSSCEGVQQICTAHARSLPPRNGMSASERVRAALSRVEKVLDSHERRYG